MSAATNTPTPAGELPAPPRDYRPLPPNITSEPNWVPVKVSRQPGTAKLKKLGINPHTGGAFMPNIPSTWGSFELAVSQARRDQREIGHVFRRGQGLRPFGIDWDNCIDPNTGNINPDVQNDIASFNGKLYLERSVGGLGIKGIGLANIPDIGKNPKGKPECYNHSRLFLTTAACLPESATGPLQDCTTESLAFIAHHYPERPTVPTATPPSSTTLDDDEILRLAEGAKNGHEFAALFCRGDASAYENDGHRADAALASHLTFYTQDFDQFMRLVFRSALKDREKWSRHDYQERTFTLAMQRSTFYTPPSPKTDTITPNSQDATTGTSDPCASVRDELAELRADNAALRRQLAERDATISDRDATITALVQTMLNPHLTHTEKIGAVSFARHVNAKHAGGRTEADGRVVISPSEISDDWREKPAPGEHLSPVNPGSGTAPHMPRSSARSVLNTALERGLIEGEKRGAMRRRADGSTYRDWEYLVSPATSFAALLDPWARWRPDTPKIRKVRESHACEHCGEVHGITRVDYCGTDNDPGCGGEVGRREIEAEAAPMGEIISPIQSVATHVMEETFSPMARPVSAESVDGRNYFSHGVPVEPAWLRDAPDPWDVPPQPLLFPLDVSPSGQSLHFGAE